MTRIDRRSFVPLYVQLGKILERQILGGELRPGQALESEPALCRIHDVSRITVRQALRDLELAGLIRREPGRGTFVAPESARNRVSIALVFGGLTERVFGHRDESSFGDVVRGAAEAAARRGALVHPIPLGEDDALDALLATPTVHAFNGLLVRLGLGFPPHVLRALDATGLPYVALKRNLGAASCAFADGVAGAEAATAHLLGLGHRRVAIVLAPREMGVGDERLAGYRAAHVAAGVEADPALVRWEGYPMTEAGYEGARALLRLGDPPTAFFASSDYIAVGVYRALREAGVEPGRDVPVVGYGGTSFSATMYPPLTTISTAGADFGRVGVDLLLDLISGSVAGPARRSVSGVLDVRRSTVWAEPEAGRRARR